MPYSCSAFRIDRKGRQIRSRLENITLDELSPGEVLVRVHYSSANYKDALAALGRARVARHFPITGGIDAAGIIIKSTDQHWRTGDRVIVHGMGMSETRDGGFAGYLRVPADWVVPLPTGLSLFDAMAIGTAGFTAALAIDRMEQNGQTPAMGPVAVTGASGGVGGFAVQLLAGRGYEVAAITGKPESGKRLKKLGASEVIPRRNICMEDAPLLSGRWGGAVDTLGGDWLAWLVRCTHPWGSVASIGNASGTAVPANVYPFILRGVSILGISSANCPMDRRKRIWQQLGGKWRPPQLALMVQETVGLEALPAIFERMLAGKAAGRVVIRIADGDG